MDVLICAQTRVSGVMTNAPLILNVDCDMFANNPEVFLHGMCLLFGFPHEVHSGYVQTPQQFYGGLKDDPFGNQLVVLQHVSNGDQFVKLSFIQRLPPTYN